MSNIYCNKLIKIIKDMELPYLRISVTNTCNAKCSICYNEGQDKEKYNGISLEKYKKVAKLFTSHFNPPRVVLTGGEPLLVPNLYEIINIYKSHKYNVGLITNGILLDKNKQSKLLEAGLDTINISLNSFDRDKYKHFYGVDKFFVLKENIENLNNYFHYPNKKINWIITSETNLEEEILSFCTLSKNFKYIISPIFDINLDMEKIKCLSNKLKKILFNKYGNPDIQTITKYKRRREYLKFSDESIWEFDNLKIEENSFLLKNNNVCKACPEDIKKTCYEGAYALRLSADGIFRPCLRRKDYEFTIDDIVSKSNIELEAKYKVSVFPLALIESLGFVKTKTSHQIDRYHIVNKILNKKRTYLRLRQDALKGNYSYEFNEIISDIAKEEIEVTLNSSDDILKMGIILDRLNYPFVCEVDKQRTIYTKGNIKLILDMVKNLGNFIEIEIMKKEDKETADLLFKIAQQLSLDKKNRIIKKGYPDMILSNKSYLENSK